MDDTIKRIKESAESLSISAASKDIFDIITKITSESVPTDIVEANSDELFRFSHYWKEAGYKNNDAVKNQLIPADILIEKTVPITDMIISSDNAHVRITISLPHSSNIREEYISQYNNSESSFHSIIIGAITFIESGLIFPLTIDMRYEAIAVAGEVIWANMPYNKFKAVSPELEKWLEDKELTETLICLMGMILPAWYGIQLALLHPVTKQIFAHPRKEKRDRKERLKPVPVQNGKPKSVKYIRHHIITEENNVNAAIDNAIKTINQSTETSGKKRIYERHTALWRVIGHHRTLSSGKVIWIAPYWKGVLKDMADVTVNNRIVDIPDKL